MFLNLAVAVDELELKLLGELLGGGLALDNAIVLPREVKELMGEGLLLLLQVVLKLLKLLDLITHLGDCVDVLLAENTGIQGWPPSGRGGVPGTRPRASR